MLQTKYLSETIEDFRSFFKNTPLKKEDFEIDETIMKIKALTEDMIEGENITLISNSKKCMLHNNQTHFMQVFLNLINNSKDIFVQKNIEGKRYVFIDSKIKDSHLIINFKDNAGGIEDVFMDKIFEPYFTTKHQYTGTGLGLYLSLTILKKYFNGTISCKNETYIYKTKEYTGAKFTIEIPLEEE
jgi:C4-dicarboxylate-specific signal transduction histidine kinase